MAQTYYSQILGWDWSKIAVIADETRFQREDMQLGSTYLGSVMNIFPSGKYWMPWTTNQNSEDMRRDSAFAQALDKVAEKFGGWIETGEGDPTDLYFVKVFENVDAR